MKSETTFERLSNVSITEVSAAKDLVKMEKEVGIDDNQKD